MAAASPGSAAAPPFVLRAVTLDYYLRKPQPPFDDCYSPAQARPAAATDAPADRVPVVRVFGATPGGQRACLHVHGALPYFYVRYEDDLPQDAAGAAAFVRALAQGTEVALRRAAARRPPPAPRQHVATATLVRARPFYGFALGESLFVRLALFDPSEVMMDLNVAGMGMLSAARVAFRGALPSAVCRHRRVAARRQGSAADAALTFEPDDAAGAAAPAPSQQGAVWTAGATPAAWHGAPPGGEARMTTCELEADARVEDILNRADVIRVPLEAASPELQLVQSLAPLWEEERRRAAAAGAPPPRRAASPERAKPPEDAFALRARDAIRAAAAAELALNPPPPEEPAAPAAAPLPPPQATAAAPLLRRVMQSAAAVGGAASTALLRGTQAANSFDSFRTHASPVTSAATVDGPAPVHDDVDEGIIATQVEHESQQRRDDETAGLLVDLLFSDGPMDVLPFPARPAAAAAAADAGAPLASPDEPGASPAEWAPPWSQEDVAALAADLELQSERVAHGGAAAAAAAALRQDLLDNSRDSEAILASQMEPPPEADRRRRTPDDTSDDDEESDEPAAPAKRARASQDRALMPPPAPRPPAIAALADSPVLPARPSVPLPAGGLYALRWKRPAPSLAELRADLQGHNLPEVVYHKAYYSAPPAPDKPRQLPEPEDGAGAPPPPRARLRPGLAEWRATLAEPSWQGALTERSPAGARGAKLFRLTLAKRPPSKASLLAWHLERRAHGATPSSQPRRADATAAQRLAAGDVIGSDSDEEWAATMGTQPSAVNAGRTGGPAQVGLCAGELPPLPPPAERARPASPKYDEGVNFLEALQFYGCEPLQQEVLPASADIAAPALAAAAPALAPAAHVVPRAPAAPPAPLLRGRAGAAAAPRGDVSQISPPSDTHASTPPSQLGFAAGGAGPGAPAHVTVMVIELFAAVRGDLLADPAHDAVQCVSLCLSDDGAPGGGAALTQLAIVVDAEASPRRHCVPGGVTLHSVPDEQALFAALVSAVRALDPDIVIGFDVHAGSLGYLAERGEALGGRWAALLCDLGRTPGHQPPGALREDAYGRDHGAGLWVTGRCVLNFWRILSGELKLGSYTYEAAMLAVLRRRVPLQPRRTLGDWWAAPAQRWRVVADVAGRARGCALMAAQLDLVGRTAELARVFGIDFHSVLLRGSQYRVESMMLRLAHAQNFLALSPDKQALQGADAPACIALVMEPRSGFYTSPVVVLDFQSLYPSQVIAYNLCYSTCLGRAPTGERAPLAGVRRKFGAADLALQPGVVPALADLIHVTPNGAMFAPPAVRPGVLPRLLSEILDTRVMVKAALKAAPPGARVLQRCLTARQLGLKLIANVTYGYTAANFSGRMPCTELADAIVSSGRDTLERAIAMVEQHPDWHAKVVYGDTDSLFVHLPGRSRAEAFRIGAAIAAAVTAANPRPVKLQLEKVYQPCILVAKKRYVGMAYSAPGDDVAPVFDAKGIEVVRRDTCALIAKTQERSLRLLFASRDLSAVRAYLQRQWARVHAGRMPLADAIFAKEVRLGSYAAERVGSLSALPPAALVAKRQAERDPRAVARYGRRVPYVVVDGGPGGSLMDCVAAPGEFLDAVARRGARLCAAYYCRLQCGALERLLGLAGADVHAWFRETPLPRVRHAAPHHAGATGGGASLGDERATITAFYASDTCAVCGAPVLGGAALCGACVRDAPGAAAVLLHGRAGRAHAQLAQLHALCLGCGGGDGTARGVVACESLDCPAFFERRKRVLELAAAEHRLRSLAW